ncbi:MAG: hypothetical protein HQM00_05140 [Magnetococcales bacterium]|nr:hypothetical protein [Magnetococcales bacterium]
MEISPLLTRHHYRAIALLDPLPAGESTVFQVLSLLQESRVRELLWVTLTGEIALGFESCHVPFLTPEAWRQQTQAILEQRLHTLLQPFATPSWQFRLLAGPANRVMSELSAAWGADLILAPAPQLSRLAGTDRPAWIARPLPLTGALHPLPAAPNPLETLLKGCYEPLKRLWSPLGMARSGPDR